MEKLTVMITESVEVVLDGETYLLEEGDEVVIEEGIMDTIKKIVFEIIKKFLPIPADSSLEKLGVVNIHGEKYDMRNNRDVVSLFKQLRKQ